jgi:hypothetical protein
VTGGGPANALKLVRFMAVFLAHACEAVLPLCVAALARTAAAESRAALGAVAELPVASPAVDGADVLARTAKIAGGRVTITSTHLSPPIRTVATFFPFVRHLILTAPSSHRRAAMWNPALIAIALTSAGAR